MSGASTITPVTLVNEMLDKLPTDIWSDSTKTFIDPACGTGIFILCCLERLNEGLKEEMPNDVERLVHIMTKQLWANDIDHQQIRRFKSSLKKLGLNKLGNIIYNNISNVNSLEYEWNMKFDVVVGNPPYNPAGSSALGQKIWDKFCLNAKYCLMKENGIILFVVPVQWRILGKKSLNKTIHKEIIPGIIFWKNCKEHFGKSIGTSIDVDYFLYKRKTVRKIQFLPKNADDRIANNIFQKLFFGNHKKIEKLKNGNPALSDNGQFKWAWTSKNWKKNKWKWASNKSETANETKVIFSSSGHSSPFFDDEGVSTYNHSHAIKASKKDSNYYIEMIDSKFVKYVSLQFVPYGSLENPLSWYIEYLPAKIDNKNLNELLNLTQEEIDHIEATIR